MVLWHYSIQIANIL